MAYQLFPLRQHVDKEDSLAVNGVLGEHEVSIGWIMDERPSQLMQCVRPTLAELQPTHLKRS